MPRVERTICPDVWAITTRIAPRSTSAMQTVVRSEGQMFCQTEKCWELWCKEPLRFLKRWRRVNVYFVHEEEVDDV